MLVKKHGYGEAKQADHDRRNTGKDVKKKIEHLLDEPGSVLGHINPGGNSQWNRQHHSQEDQCQRSDHRREKTVEDLPFQKQGVDRGRVSEDKVQIQSAGAFEDDMAENRRNGADQDKSAAPRKKDDEAIRRFHRCCSSRPNTPKSRVTAIRTATNTYNSKPQAKMDLNSRLS